MALFGRNVNTNIVVLQYVYDGLAEFRVEMLNAFNWINYSPSTGVGSSTRDGFETNSLTGLTQSRIIQLVSRVSW